MTTDQERYLAEKNTWSHESLPWVVAFGDDEHLMSCRSVDIDETDPEYRPVAEMIAVCEFVLVHSEVVAAPTMVGSAAVGEIYATVETRDRMFRGEWFPEFGMMLQTQRNA